MLSHVSQILIAGSGSAILNLGDEVIFASMLQDLRNQFPNARVGVMSANPPGILDRYGVQEIRDSDIQALIEFARQSDLLILGGGGLFYDYWGFAFERLLTQQQTGVGIFLGFALLATLLNKPLMIYAVGVGPLSSEIGKRYTRLAFEQAIIISVRDTQSKELLIQLGIHPDRIRVTADPAWRFPDVSPALGKDLLQNIGLNSTSPILAVSVRSWTYSENQQWEVELAHALDNFVTYQQGTVLFIPFDGITNDYAQSEKIKNLMESRSSAYVLDADLSTEEKISILRNCDLMLGMRLHANILAMRYGIPVVGLVYDPKVANLFVEIGKSEYALDLDLCTAQTLHTLFQKAWAERDNLRAFYEKTIQAMSARAKENVLLAKEAVQHGCLPNSFLSTDTLQWIKDVAIENITHSQEQIQSLTSYIAAQQNQIAAQQNQIAAQQNQIQVQQAQIEALNSQIHLIFQSSSWKITRPLRFLKRLFTAPRRAIQELINCPPRKS